jgi:hypothetical protein
MDNKMGSKEITTPPHPLTHKHNTLTTRMNRLRSQKMVIQNKLLLKSKAERKARTRTLIQVGSLVNMLGLLEMCNIQEGDDLQLDLTNHDKAATLLGMLVTLAQRLPTNLTAEQERSFKQKGINAFKFHYAKNLSK